MMSEEKQQQFEAYQPTDDFEKDFEELASIISLPVSLCEQKRLPGSNTSPEVPPNTPSTPKGKKWTRLKSVLLMAQKTPDPPAPTPVPAEPECKTYTIAPPGMAYFKPQVFFDVEEDGNKRHVRKLFVRGWLADDRILAIFSKTFPHLERLTHLDMWHTGLTDQTLKDLHHCLKSCTSLKTLNLDGNNHVQKKQFDQFLLLPALVKFSLRNCDINSHGALLLANRLTENKTLLTLNLSHNKIGDEGLKHLANSLSLNRTLLSLNISSNGITDKGVSHIGKALTEFPLTHEQVTKRRLYLASFKKEVAKVEVLPTKKYSTSVSSRKKSKVTRRDRAQTETTSLKRSNSRKGKLVESPPPLPLPKMNPNPIYGKSEFRDGELWIQGNRVLVNSNLSRNKISSTGLCILLDTIKKQGSEQPVNFELDEGATKHGLIRLSLLKNDFRTSDVNYLEICDLLRSRDPFNSTLDE